MYKVFVNNKPLILTSQKSGEDLQVKNILKLDFKTEKEIHTALDILYFDKNFSGAIIFSDNETILWKKFCEQFTILEAAGGVVLNNQKDILMIYRFEKWDLPKGKIEKGEEPEHTALREVCEETGVCDLKIIKALDTAYHTYFHKDKNILKKTFWFQMVCKNFSQFQLQDEEGIKDARWMNKEQLIKAMENTYPSIEELLKNYF